MANSGAVFGLSRPISTTWNKAVVYYRVGEFSGKIRRFFWPAVRRAGGIRDHQRCQGDQRVERRQPVARIQMRVTGADDRNPEAGVYPFLKFAEAGREENGNAHQLAGAQ